MKRRPGEPKFTRDVARGILALVNPGVCDAVNAGTAHPNAAPDVGPGDAERARKAILAARLWLEWKDADDKRKAKALRARARRLTAGGAR